MACHSARIREIRDALQLTLIACTAAGKSEGSVSARKLCACARMTNSCHKRWQIAAARKRNLSRFRTATACSDAFKAFGTGIKTRWANPLSRASVLIQSLRRNLRSEFLWTMEARSNALPQRSPRGAAEFARRARTA